MENKKYNVQKSFLPYNLLVMKIEKFEDMLVWQKSKDLVIEIYRSCRELKDFWFRDQIQRASVSVMNNIAEGFEKKWNKEFIKFLYIAKWSCGEVRSMLYVALEMKFFSEQSCKNISDLSTEISRMLWWLIKSLNSQPN